MLAFLVSVSSGCVAETTAEFGAGSDTAAPEPPFATPADVRRVEVAYDEGAGASDHPAALAPSASPLDRPRRDPVFFHLGAGYGVLGQIDLAPCREQGLAPGYLRMRVTFRDDGHVVRAAVESPVAPPGEALLCIGEQLKLAMVPVFEGGEVTLSKSFFVN